MMRNVKPYPEYKDSGVEWLGEVPAHWEVRRAKTLLRPIDVRSRDGSEELLTVSSNLGVIPRSSASVTMFKAESYVGYKLCWPGDLVINSLWAWARGLGVTKYHGIISSAYGVYRRLAHAELNVGFLDKLVRSEPFHWELRVRSKGIWISRLQLTDESFLGAPLPLPPLPEQTAIVRFLDYVDRRVRRVIRSRRRLVKLLEEYKQALIHQAVTGRIDVRTGQPYPEYKDSGVEWLGQVPAHWEVNHLSRCLARIDQGWSPRAAEGDLADNQWAVLTLSAVRKGVFDAKAVKPIPLGTPIREGIQVADGDLLMTRSNTRELVGDVCIVRGVRPKTVLCDLVYRLVVHSDLLDAEFLMLLLLSRIGRSQIEREARGSSGTMPKVSQQRIRALVVLLPPLTEQTSIVEYLDEQTGKVDRAIEAAQREIELLQEFRTRLIADVVTGKLDVREVVARLPEEPEEPEPLDELEENTELEEAADDLDEASEEAVA